MNRSRSRTNIAFNSPDVAREIDFDDTVGDTPVSVAAKPKPNGGNTAQQQRRKRDTNNANGSHALMAQLEAALSQ